MIQQWHRKNKIILNTDISPISIVSSRLVLEQRYIFFCIIILHIFFLFSTPSSAKESSSIVTTNRFESYPMQNAVEHAKLQYGIEILVKDELLHERVAPWDKETLSAEKWIAQVFKFYDKIAIYNNQGRVKTIKIVGLKNDQGTILQASLNDSEAKPRPQNLAQAEYPVAANKIVFPKTPEYSPQEIEESIINHQYGEQSLPEGVIIYNSNESTDADLPADVIITNSPLENVSKAEDIFTQ